MADKIVGIRFKTAGKVYYFDPADLDLEVNDYVVVETSRGMELGKVVIAPRPVPANEINEPFKPVTRKAEPEDVSRIQELEARS